MSLSLLYLQSKYHVTRLAHYSLLIIWILEVNCSSPTRSISVYWVLFSFLLFVFVVGFLLVKYIVYVICTFVFYFLLRSHSDRLWYIPLFYFPLLLFFIYSSRWSPDRLLEGLLFIYLPLYFLSHLYLYHELVRFLLFAAILLWPTLVRSSVLFSFVVIFICSSQKSLTSC